MNTLLSISLLLALLITPLSHPYVYAEKNQASLPALNANIGETSVSGLSSGAYMTSQLYVAYSDIMVGAGIIAGGPYYCAGSWVTEPFLTNASTACMHPLLPTYGPNTPFLVKKAKDFAKNGKIDSLDNLQHDRIYLFSGKNDSTVTTDVVNQTQQFFLDLNVNVDNILYNDKTDAGHAIITNSTDAVKCSSTHSPYINNCGFVQSHRILNHIYPDLNPVSKKLSGEIIAFSQNEFIDSDRSSMGDTGYVYVPEKCKKSNAASCKIHVVFHGCKQGASIIGDEFYANTGYNEMADSNNIIVLYPQVKKSGATPFNPEGCWDFWGYSAAKPTDPDFYSKQAPQIKAVYRMISRLASKNTASLEN